MLELQNVSKTYYASGEAIKALQGISLSFRQSEFVAMLGPSGCGKTTMLNIIGGLDRYDSGDLVIKGVSTKAFKDGDWDAYRNRSIGFVFQNYNLIGHQTVLQNVELAMTLSGVGATERRNRATAVLEEVGLADKLNKKPNQLSGGQMQRVAIARALVNNPEIIMADEPTGALDSVTSIQIMEILKEIAHTRLVIMVTHNPTIAEKYATRTIKLLDGAVQSDSNPPEKEELTPPEKRTYKKTAMSLWTATALSFKNLLTKKGRTLTTAFAGSVGIISVALVLALSTGLTRYMDAMQSDILVSFPITIIIGIPHPLNITGWAGVAFEPHPDDERIHRFNSQDYLIHHINIPTEEFWQHIEAMSDALPTSAINTISHERIAAMNVLSNAGDTVVQLNTLIHESGAMGVIMQGMMPGMSGMGGDNPWQELPDNHDFILSMYDLIGENSRMPQNKNEILLIIDEYNRLPESLFANLGIHSDQQAFDFNDFLGQSFLRLAHHNDFFQREGDIFTMATPARQQALFDSENSIPLTIVGILRIREDASSAFFSEGFAYTSLLTAFVLEEVANSEIVRTALENPDINVLTGAPFTTDMETIVNQIIGADPTPVAINIFPADFASKELIAEYLDAFNDNRLMEDRIAYNDLAEMISVITATLLGLVSSVLIGFASISLVVSTIMIGIVTSVSVVERTKEIGILRSVGARKKDISRVFSAEAIIIGFTAGAIGVGIAALLTIPINIIVSNLVDGGLHTNIAVLTPAHAGLLIAGSMVLTIIAGYLPSKTAARKDPVEALRTD
ncbi:MAG: ATP-binding cassette domain-containing protein [Defluviitaleaceae bacterium]|nr:ATP-binding cassette domain-containing protein [Defluviitaleaceae bacterium]